MKRFYNLIILAAFCLVSSVGVGQVFSPTRGSSEVSISPTLTITFGNTDNVNLGISKNIYIYNSDYTLITSLPTGGSPFPPRDSRLSVSGNTLTIDLTGLTLDYKKEHIVYSDVGAILLNGSAWDNLTNPTYWTFTTEAAIPEITWKGGESSNWNASENWTKGVAPSNENPANITIPSSAVFWPNLTGNTIINDLTIEAGGAVKVSSSGNLQILGSIHLKSAIDYNASLLVNGQINYSAEKVIIEQSISSYNRTYHVSPPVTGATTSAIGTDVATYYWDNPSGSWLPGSGNMDVTTGYALRSSSDLQFSGSINTGEHVIPVNEGNTSFSFIGNPYTNAINWKNVILSEGIEDKFWIWHNLTGQYGSYNNVLGESVNLDGDSIIPSNHGFWVQTKLGYTSGTITLNNTCKTLRKLSYLKSTTQANYPFFKLATSNGITRDEAIVAFSDNELIRNEINTVKKFSTNNIPAQLYFTNSNDTLCIRGVKNFKDELVVPLGVKINQIGDYSIERISSQDFNEDILVVLEDLETQTTTNLLSEKTYSFTSDVTGNIENRFQLKFIGNLATSVNDKPVIETKVWCENRNIFINLNSEHMANVSIYNIAGSLITSRNDIQHSASFAMSKPGVYIIKIEINGLIKAHKIFVQ